MNDENLAHQIMDAMDGIRAYVWYDHNVLPHWRDRLTDTAGLRAQQQQWTKFIHEFQRQNCIDAAANELGDKAALGAIFADAAKDMINCQHELEFQRQWIIAASSVAASSAHTRGQTVLASRLAYVYRLMYGGDLHYEPVPNPVAFRADTVANVARQLDLLVYDHELTYHEWHDSDMQWFSIRDEDVRDQQKQIYRALQRRDLLDNPCQSEIGRRLDAAYRASMFRDTLNAFDEKWVCSILGALDSANVALASRLMRLYSHMFGMVLRIEGHSLNWPAFGVGHVPESPSEQQVKRCLFECNRLRAAWISRRKDANEERAERKCGRVMVRYADAD
jgi:hypothetical protein